MIEAHSFQQSELFNGALALLGRPPQWLAMPTGSVFALRRFGLSLATRPHDAPETYAELAKKRIRIINAESAHPALRQYGYRQLIKPAHIASLALSPDPVIQRAAMQPKWRRSLERFEAERPKHITLTHRAFDPDRDAWLLEAEAAQARTRRFRCYPSALTCALSAASPKSLRLFSLNGPEAPRAAMLFALHGPRATYHIGYTSPDARKIEAHWLLMWKAFQELPAYRISEMELGLVDTESGANLARFKLGTGAVTRPLGGTWGRLF